MVDRRLTVYDFRDTDLLAKLAEQGATGAASHELAADLGLDGKRGAQHVGARLGWMRHFGMLNFDEKARIWTLTPGAERVLESHIRAAAAKQLEAVPDDAIVEVMSHVTARYRLGDPMVAALLRREFQYGTDPRSSAWRRGRR